MTDVWARRTFGDYRVVEKLGGGGMWERWKAEDLNLGRPVEYSC